MIHEYDVVVVGGGIAGLYTALTAAEQCRVAVVSKVHVTRSHSVAAAGWNCRKPWKRGRRPIGMAHGIWGCKGYYMCTMVCPKNIKVTEAILKTKKKIIQELHP